MAKRISDQLRQAKASCDLRPLLEARGYAFQRGPGGLLQENPIRTEKTSSIHVRTDEPHLWHDFGSGEGGDVIDFLQATEGLDWDRAVEEVEVMLSVASSSSSSTPRQGPGGASLKNSTAKWCQAAWFFRVASVVARQRVSSVKQTIHRHRGASVRAGRLHGP